MKNKIIIILLVLVIAVGAFIAFTNGFALDFEYAGYKKLNIQFSEDFALNDVDSLAKEVLKDKEYKIDYFDDFEAGVAIKVKEISEEEVKRLEEKIKEKYPSFVSEHEEEENVETEHIVIQQQDIPRAKIYDLTKIYIMPVIISTILVIAFLGVIFHKLGLVKSFGIPTRNNYRNNSTICCNYSNFKSTT